MISVYPNFQVFTAHTSALTYFPDTACKYVKPFHKQTLQTFPPDGMGYMRTGYKVSFSRNGSMLAHKRYALLVVECGGYRTNIYILGRIPV